MVEVKPLIILRADFIEPKIVPAAFMTLFDRLANYILPKLGFHIAIEFFQTGWVGFFGSVSDFRNYFGRPLFSNSRKSSMNEYKEGETPLIWEYKIERLPSHPPEEFLIKILKRFYSVPGALGERHIQEIDDPGSGKRIQIMIPSLAGYINYLEDLVRQAYQMIFRFKVALL